ncbi:UNKNOWN [Stylonychia lemnae]|uniref:Uncharacterized protein n=1 Tax=Stylonychia lemnae TaxID=5949 RepID=A0A078B716_STYLE|nr:UNKNOWN [Stylonychia lemnae]|eukprot:CDW89097.1 UNKNOWN [Stylonychia lemnae]
MNNSSHYQKLGRQGQRECNNNYLNYIELKRNDKRTGPVRAKHPANLTANYPIHHEVYTSQRQHYNQHNQPSSLPRDVPSNTAKSLEKSKKKTFSLIELMAKTKQQLTFEINAPDHHKISLMNQIETMINDLNNQIVNISEDLGKSRQGISINIDSKRTKRKVRRLDEQVNDIIQKVQQLTLDERSTGTDKSRTQLKVNNFQVYNDNSSLSTNLSSQIRKPTLLDPQHIQHDMRSLSRPRHEYGSNPMSTHYAARQEMFYHNNNQSIGSLGNENYPSIHSSHNLSQIQKSKSELQKKQHPNRYQQLFNQNDETWKKLQELINIGTDSAINLNLLNTSGSQEDKSNAGPAIKIPDRFDNASVNQSSNFNQPSQQIKIKDYLDQQAQPKNSATNSLPTIQKESTVEIEQLRNQIKEVMQITKDQGHQTSLKMQTLEHQSSQLEFQLTKVAQEQSKMTENFQQLENRYKDIIKENQAIKNELLDLRKNRQIITKVTPDSSFNLPLNRTNINETVAGHKQTESDFFTPNKTRDTERTIKRDHYNISTGNCDKPLINDQYLHYSNANNLSMFSQEKTMPSTIQNTETNHQVKLNGKLSLNQNTSSYYAAPFHSKLNSAYDKSGGVQIQQHNNANNNDRHLADYRFNKYSQQQQYVL